mmetsp:Transcript_6046/g.6185  ORF Transcript_6046/g.6185 Transcript_6046/m.6185 type:complete len:648 (-) Transcript_6046:218-2161(-)
MAESCLSAAGAPDDARRSKYPMISVEDAIVHVLKNSSALSLIEVPLMETCGRVVAIDVTAQDPFPAFRASIMDGYAVGADLEPGIYPVQQRIHAGDTSDRSETLRPGHIVYITTGAMVPEGAQGVVKIEDTSAVGSMDSKVHVHVKIPNGCNIRQIGSDINKGEVIIKKGTVVGPAEVGLLATVGVMSVLCYSQPVIGILSTGSELVNPWEVPTGSQIRDSNRATMLAAFKADGYSCIDLGIVKDSNQDLELVLQQAIATCDVIVTSGGVSMGDADLVKPMLESLGTVHFGRLNMKPGKPTTFATLKKSDKNVLFFGLPGNPVSCLVTKSLFVDPALRKLHGLNSAESMHAQLIVEVDSDLKLDPERPEYHRAILGISSSGSVTAKSTGIQRSSRLLSMSSANALLCLPQGNGSVPAGTKVTAILTGSLPSPPSSACYHKAAACIDFPLIDTPVSKDTGVIADLNPMKTKSMSIRVGLLTISDRASQGVYPDESGPEMQKCLISMANTLDSKGQKWPIELNIVHTLIVPDEPERITEIINVWCESNSDWEFPMDLILTSGGTGFGERDFTPETIRPLLHREAPGVAQALLNEGLKYTPLAVLSRPVVGTRHNTLICTLPGSVKAVRENIKALGPLLPRIMELTRYRP